MAVSKYKTLLDIKTKIRQDLDLEEEVFVRSDELTGLINEAIDETEAEIHALYEDYFLAKDTLTLVNGTQEYDLPADIYAHKIRAIMYANGSKVYRIARLKDFAKFEEKSVADNNSQSSIYSYFLVNEVAGAPKILLVPPAREAGAYVTVWYLRQANHLAVDGDYCDIPEFYNFIYALIKVRVMQKEVHPGLADARLELDKQRALMQGTLASMVPDAENEIEPDLSYYTDHV